MESISRGNYNFGKSYFECGDVTIQTTALCLFINPVDFVIHDEDNKTRFSLVDATCDNDEIPSLDNLLHIIPRATPSIILAPEIQL